MKESKEQKKSEMKTKDKNISTHQEDRTQLRIEVAGTLSSIRRCLYMSSLHQMQHDLESILYNEKNQRLKKKWDYLDVDDCDIQISLFNQGLLEIS